MPPKQKAPTKEELMAMNRKERRRIGKIFQVHITGSNKPIINEQKK